MQGDPPAGASGRSRGESLLEGAAVGVPGRLGGERLLESASAEAPGHFCGEGLWGALPEKQKGRPDRAACVSEISLESLRAVRQQRTSGPTGGSEVWEWTFSFIVVRGWRLIRAAQAAWTR